MLFTDVVVCDVMDPIYGYLVCSIVCNGAMKMSSSMGSISEGGIRFNHRGHAEHYGNELNGCADLPPQFCRPFECVLLKLAQLKKMATEGIKISSTKEHMMPISSFMSFLRVGSLGAIAGTCRSASRCGTRTGAQLRTLVS